MTSKSALPCPAAPRQANCVCACACGCLCANSLRVTSVSLASNSALRLVDRTRMVSALCPDQCALLLCMLDLRALKAMLYLLTAALPFRILMPVKHAHLAFSIMRSSQLCRGQSRRLAHQRFCVFCNSSCLDVQVCPSLPCCSQCCNQQRLISADCPAYSKHLFPKNWASHTHILPPTSQV